MRSEGKNMGDTDSVAIIVAIGTIALVLVTIWYAYSTHKILKEQQKARKEEVQPKLWAKLDFITTTSCCLKIESIGRGPAFHIKAKYSVVPNGGTRKWHYPILSPKEYMRFMLPVPANDNKLENLCNKYEKVIVKFNYVDLYGEKLTSQTIIDLKSFKEGIREGKIIFDKPLINHIKNIEEQLTKISGSIGSLSSEKNTKK